MFLGALWRCTLPATSNLDSYHGTLFPASALGLRQTIAFLIQRIFVRLGRNFEAPGTPLQRCRELRQVFRSQPPKATSGFRVPASAHLFPLRFFRKPEAESPKPVSNSFRRPQFCAAGPRIAIVL